MFLGQRPNQDKKTSDFENRDVQRCTDNPIQNKEVLTIWCREKKYKQCNTDQRNTDNLMQRKEVQTI